MTCIAGLVDGTSGRVVIGGDSCAFSGWDITPGVVKVFHNGPYLIGTSGDAREGQLLRYALTVPEQPEDMEPQRFMSTMFVDALRACFKDAGYAQKEKEKGDYSGEGRVEWLAGEDGLEGGEQRYPLFSEGREVPAQASERIGAVV
jgi:hypothetical protein